MPASTVVRALFVTFIVTCISISADGTASAAPTAPSWSGMDVVDYSGVVPRQPGSVLQSVPLDRTLVDADFPQVRDARRFLYSSTDNTGAATLSTAAVFVPSGVAPAGGWPVMAWAHGTVGIGDDCAPSGHSLNPGFSEETDFLNSFLDRGYAIVATDYAGAGTPGTQKYLNATSEGRNVIDSVRAVHNLGLELSENWSVVGFSQGGGAALGTGSQVTQYSPDLAASFKGTVSIAGSANLEYLLPALGPGVPPVGLTVLNPRLSLYIALTLAGFRSFYPDLDLDSYLSPLGRDLLRHAEQVCFSSPDQATGYEDVVIGDMFVKPLGAISGIVDLFRTYQGSPVTGFDRPVLLLQGLLDKDVPMTFSNVATAPEIAARGRQVDVKIYPAYDHGTTIANAASDVHEFLEPLYR
ncbi:lipase family protein [Rhodococcoides yunnanense]|uniref:Lipase family protein n=1 Tax=Rhodococcoides yunnanense TaxID=278209 RepID=A0ABU4B6I0_9NOCA|nr:lipase family protein [Rhodococcus yunnanensis]MDV6259799.1 lipase family protein [Rhodococcus yunnanensis]